MNISEAMMSHEQLIYIFAKIIANTDKYPSCRKLLLSGIHLIGKDDLMHGLDDFKHYQNAFVKHDDGERITEKDADLCFKQALLLIMSLVCKK